MNHLLISDIARQEIEDRLRVARLDRLARSASRPARRPAGRVSRMLSGARHSLADRLGRSAPAIVVPGTMTAPLATDCCIESPFP